MPFSLYRILQWWWQPPTLSHSLSYLPADGLWTNNEADFQMTRATNNVNILTSDVLKLHNQNNIKWGRSEVSATASITCPPTGFGPTARPTAAADRKADQKGRHTSDIRRLATKTQLISTTVGGGPTFNGLMWLQGEILLHKCSTDEIYCLYM